MRIAILGAGAMGSWFGGRLAMQGSDVELLTTNQAHIGAVQDKGLILRSATAEQCLSIPIHRPEEVQAPVDIILLFTKTFQSDRAMASVAHAITSDTHVLTLQNGIGNADIIANYVALEQTWIGVTMMPVDLLGPGIVASTGSGVSYFGGAVGQEHAVAHHLLQAFQATDLDVRLVQDIHRRVWEKVAFNAGMNAFCALARGTPGTIGKSPGAHDLVKDVAVEVAAVALTQEVEIDLDSVVNTIDFACAEHGEHKPSMLQDLLAKRPTEVAALNGAVVALADSAGVPVPMNRLLATLVTLAEIAQREAD